MEIVRIRADEVFHLFCPLRSGQISGELWLARVLVSLHKLDDDDDDDDDDDAERVYKKPLRCLT